MGILSRFFNGSNVYAGLPHNEVELTNTERKIFDGYATAILCGLMSRSDRSLSQRSVDAILAMVCNNAFLCLQIRKHHDFAQNGICPADQYVWAVLTGLASRSDTDFHTDSALPLLKQAFDLAVAASNFRAQTFRGPDISELL